jgi:hypothetical protein
MSDSKLIAEGDFLVKESSTINFIAGGALLAVFFVSLLFGDYGWNNFLVSICIFLIPGTLAIMRGNRNPTIMRINKNGFFYGGKLITNWQLFYDAQVYDRMAVGSYKDNFVMDLRYYSSDYSLIYTNSIPLTSTQDKVSEEIIEAINFYYSGSRLPTEQRTEHTSETRAVDTHSQQSTNTIA